MREIKFRAWVNDHWVDWLPNSKTLGEYNEVGIYADEYNTESKCFIEQYTGLRDKNGKEIYEGDIVTDALGNKHTVEWDDEEVRYYFQPVGSTYYYDRVAPETTDYSTMEGRWSVIGNIHENPELLGGKK